MQDLILEFYVVVPDAKKTMGIPRKEMPQINSTDLSDFIKFLKKNGINTTKKIVDPNTLKATQGQFDKSKIKDMLDKVDSGELDDKPIVISKDNYVMDGHHRWLAFTNLNRDMQVFQVNLNAKELLQKMSEYPKTFNKNLYEWFDLICEKDGCPIITVGQMKQFEILVDRMFEKYKINFDFTKHFRERMSDERNDPCISLRELAILIRKIYEKNKKEGKTLASHKDSELVIKDMQSDLNMPIAIEYNRSKDEFRVAAKTVMRKKDFRTPSPVIKV
jgi:hypothetical protein